MGEREVSKSWLVIIWDPAKPRETLRVDGHYYEEDHARAMLHSMTGLGFVGWLVQCHEHSGAGFLGIPDELFDYTEMLKRAGRP